MKQKKGLVQIEIANREERIKSNHSTQLSREEENGCEELKRQRR